MTMFRRLTFGVDPTRADVAKNEEPETPASWLISTCQSSYDVALKSWIVQATQWQEGVLHVGSRLLRKMAITAVRLSKSACDLFPRNRGRSLAMIATALGDSLMKTLARQDSATALRHRIRLFALLN
jgi:hypothetical protein